jgi:hypothetical protein
MTAIALPILQLEELRAETSQDENGVLVRLLGTAESASMKALDGFLKKLHAEAVAHNVSEVTVDLRQLEFMNSSCFKVFVTWIGELEGVERERQYKIRFLADEDKDWQRRSLGAPGCFNVELTRVEM